MNQTSPCLATKLQVLLMVPMNLSMDIQHKKNPLVTDVYGKIFFYLIDFFLQV
jgi:hypothetical protein